MFTDRPLTGNALAVFTDAAGLDDSTMQALAREMNLSESTFVLPPTTPDADARIRIFTPRMELPFAGHPTLGSAFVLAAPLQRDDIRLETGRGVIAVRFAREGSRIGFGWMTQPLPRRAPFTASAALLAALGVDASGLPIELYDNGPQHVIVELGSPDAVAALQPDLARLAALGGSSSPSLRATASAGRAACSRPEGVFRRIRRPARRPVRSRCTSPATAGSIRRDDRDRAGGRDRPAVHAARARDRQRRAAGPGRGGRQRRRGRARGI